MEKESIQAIRRIKKPLYKVIFSRFFLVIIFLIMQLFLLLWLFLKVHTYYSKYIVPYELCGLLMVIWIMNSRTNPTYKLSWSVLVAFLPVMGSILYIYANTSMSSFFSKHHLNETIEETKPYAVSSKQVKKLIEAQPHDIIKTARYLERYSFPAYSDTKVKYYPLGDAVFDDIIEALENAKKFIFIEFFIIEEGFFWNSVLEVLKRKQREGVEIRVIYDDLGCATTLPRYYYRTLNKMGIKTKVFARVKPLFSIYYNNRDHRKMIITDGTTVFSGGFNIADEYLNLIERFGHWKDMGFKLEGSAVRSYTMMFLQMWNSTEHRLRRDKYVRYLGNNSESQTETGAFVVPYSDGPHNAANVAENVYLDVINSADEHVWIMTPYLIPDNEMLHALKHAAQSGVDVRIILPGIPDKKIINILTKSYCPELMRNGVRIYEYRDGFVHSKLMEADRTVAVAGTINMDFRSLDLHYECASLLYKDPSVQDIYADFHETFELCKEFTEADYKKQGIIYAMAAMILRLFAPML